MFCRLRTRYRDTSTICTNRLTVLHTSSMTIATSYRARIRVIILNFLPLLATNRPQSYQISLHPTTSFSPQLRANQIHLPGRRAISIGALLLFTSSPPFSSFLLTARTRRPTTTSTLTTLVQSSFPRTHTRSAFIFRESVARDNTTNPS